MISLTHIREDSLTQFLNTKCMYQGHFYRYEQNYSSIRQKISRSTHLATSQVFTKMSPISLIQNSKLYNEQNILFLNES